MFWLNIGCVMIGAVINLLICMLIKQIFPMRKYNDTHYCTLYSFLYTILLFPALLIATRGDFWLAMPYLWGGGMLGSMVAIFLEINASARLYKLESLKKKRGKLLSRITDKQYEAVATLFPELFDEELSALRGEAEEIEQQLRKLESEQWEEPAEVTPALPPVGRGDEPSAL